MTDSYAEAGLTSAEVGSISELVAAVESADRTAPWVAVRRTDVLGVVAALDRLVDRSGGAASPPPREP